MYLAQRGFFSSGNQVRPFLEEDAHCGVSASVSKNANTINLSAKVKVGETGSYRIVAWLLEDGIKATQAKSGRTSDR